MTITISIPRRDKTLTPYIAIFDDSDNDLLVKLGVIKHRYVIRSIRENGKRIMIRLHREILERKLERQLLDSELVDHINGNSFDNRRDNLRIATNAQNLANRGKQVNNTSGYKGVFKAGNKWQASIKANGKKHYIGVYDTPELAHKAYCEKAKELHGDYANFGD